MSPLTFGAVCSSWRQIAWLTPTLWTSVQPNLNQAADFHAALIEEWLLGSMGRPLAISATRDVDDASSDGASIDIIGVIARYSQQWQKVELELQLPYACYVAPECVRDRLPILQFISIHRTMEIFELPEISSASPRSFIPLKWVVRSSESCSLRNS